MKPGVRALGIADSYVDERSVVAGCVARADRVVDEFVFGQWTVGGTDATATVIDLFDRLGREDVQYMLLAGIAPAWFNVLDLTEIHEATGLPTLSVSFEESDGLENAIRDAFESNDAVEITDEIEDEDEEAAKGAAKGAAEGAVETRLSIYRRQPERRSLSVNGETVFVRSVGLDDETAATVVRGFTPEGGRPEPLRVARLAARAGDEFFDPP